MSVEARIYEFKQLVKNGKFKESDQSWYFANDRYYRSVFLLGPLYPNEIDSIKCPK